MEGLFDLDVDSRRNNLNSPSSAALRKRGNGSKNISPVALKNRIEVLQNENKK